LKHANVRLVRRWTVRIVGLAIVASASLMALLFISGLKSGTEVSVCVSCAYKQEAKYYCGWMGVRIGRDALQSETALSVFLKPCSQQHQWVVMYDSHMSDPLREAFARRLERKLEQRLGFKGSLTHQELEYVSDYCMCARTYSGRTRNQPCPIWTPSQGGLKAPPKGDTSRGRGRAMFWLQTTRWPSHPKLAPVSVTATSGGAAQ